MTAPDLVTSAEGERWVWRLRHLVVSGLLVAVSLNTAPGKMVSDTKLDLSVNPAAFLARALHLWDPLGSAGQLQNQAYGYLFPMGPFFLGGHAAGMPEWVVQRLWWALVLVVSYTGFVALLRRLAIGTDWTRLVAGLGFALAPHVLTVLGRSSVEVWPPALAPWVLLPLVTHGSVGRPRRAAALSGLAVVAMGGVNATVDLAAVLPAALWLMTRRLDRSWVRLALLWVAALVAATAWWILPLIVLGRYSPPFLDYIESSSFTTSTTSLVETLRGTSDWVAYLYGSGSRAGLALLTERLLIVNTVLLVALGLFGLARRGTRERSWLVLMVVVGVVLSTLGHDGVPQGLFAGDIRAALDGVLAPLRNVHKFDILIRIGLYAGVAAGLAELSRGRTQVETRFLRPLVAAAGAFLVVGASTPFFGLQAAPAQAFDGIPGYWKDASQWLAAHDAAGRTLLLPGSRFADYQWGYPGDEPIQSLDEAAWDVRNAVPLTDPGHVRWLDGVERRLASGEGGADLARSLADAGVGYLLLRSDLNHGAQGATRPVIIRSALAASPGLERVATFGPMVGGGGGPALASDQRLGIAAPAIEVYRVLSGSATVSLAPADDVGRVAGGAEFASRPTMLSPSPFTLAGSGAASDRARVVLTDTPARREVNVGVGAFGASYTLTPSDRMRIQKKVRDYGSSDRPGSEAVARFLDGAAVTASSSAGDADTYPRADPSALPYAAFDESLRTEWRPNPGAPWQRAWLAADFGRTVDLTGGSVLLDPRTVARTVTLTTDRGRTTLTVVDDRVDLPAVQTRRMRVSFGDVDGDRTEVARLGIRTIYVPGARIERTVELPVGPEGRSPDEISLRADTGRPGCFFVGDRPLCGVGLWSAGEDSGGLDRSWTMPSGQQMSLSVRARAVASPALEERVARALDLPVGATVTSQAVPDLVAGSLAAVDGDLGTAWVADPADPDPAITLTFPSTRRVDRLQILLDDAVGATRPTSVLVTSSAGERTAPVAADGSVSFAPLRAKALTVRLRADAGLAQSLDPYTLVQSGMGLGASEIRVPGATPDVRVSSNRLSTPVRFACGEGPTLTLDGDRIATRVDTTVGAVLRAESVDVVVCGSAEVEVPQGQVRLRALAPDVWDVTDVTLARAAESGTGQGGQDPSATAQVQQWGATERSVGLSARTVATVLRISENQNAGWRATLGGTVLRPLTIDGWQQGWVVPAGEAGVVRLSFTPDGPVRVGMLAAGCLTVALLVLALLPEKRRLHGVRRAGPGAGTGVLLVGTAGLALVGGWVAVGLLVLGLVVRDRYPAPWRPRFAQSTTDWAPVTASAAYGLAGLVLVTGPYLHSPYRAGEPLTQVLCLVALVALIVSAAPHVFRRAPRR